MLTAPVQSFCVKWSSGYPPDSAVRKCRRGYWLFGDSLSLPFSQSLQSLSLGEPKAGRATTHNLWRHTSPRNMVNLIDRGVPEEIESDGPARLWKAKLGSRNPTLVQSSRAERCSWERTTKTRETRATRGKLPMERLNLSTGPFFSAWRKSPASSSGKQYTPLLIRGKCLLGPDSVSVQRRSWRRAAFIT